MMRVMFDLDGVLRNWEKAFRIKWWSEFGYMPEPFTHWDHIYDLAANEGFTKSEAKYLIFDAWGNHLMSTAELYPNALRVFRLVRRFSVNTIIVTDAPTDNTKLGTLEWISKHGLLPDGIYFTKRKVSVLADFYVEDNQDTLESLAKAWPFSTIVGIRRAWNDVDNIENVIPVDSIDDYYDIIRQGVGNEFG